MPNTSKLPEIALTCRDGHSIRTRARGGQAIKCPTCRVSVWVPSDRGAGAGETGEASELAQRWEAEQDQPAAALEPSGHTCPECESVLSWEPGRTLLVCSACEYSGLPPEVGRRYAELEVRRSGPTDLERAQRRIDEVKQRMKLSEQKDQTAYVIERLIHLVDPGRLPDDSNLIKVAVKLQSNLNHLLREIKRADTPDEFAAVDSIGIELCQTVVDWKPQFEAEHRRAAELEAEDEGDEYEDADWDEDEDDEYEDEDEDEAEDEPAPARPRQYVPGPYIPRPLVNQAPRVPAPLQVPTVPTMINRAAAARALRKNCQFDHFFGRAADRRLWPIQWNGGPPVQGEPFVYCCAAHNDAALEWIGSKGYAWANTELLGESANA